MENDKGKAAAHVSPPAPPATEKSQSDDRKEESSAAASLSSAPARLPSRNASSKYDFVKVKVWLGENADHYYVLSRFLLSRMLTVTKIPNHIAIKIALELKKLLIDNSLLDVSQSDLEANLFKLMERRGYGEEYINRYKMMTRFHHQRVPLVILVCGTACAGKSTIATQLAQRLNLPNVLQTDMVYELLRTSTDAPLVSTPVWARDFNSSEELITEFCRECRIVRKGLAGDLKKAMKDGKPIIIEGIHLDPSIYLMDEEKRELPSEPNNNKSINSAASEKISITQDECKPEVTSELEKFHSMRLGNSRDASGSSETCDLEDTEAILAPESASPDCQTSKNKGNVSGEGALKTSMSKQEKSAPEPIIVPIVLKMAEFDHKALLEEWISTRTFGDKCLNQDQQKLINNLKTIQDYLCSFESQGLTVVNISATTFPQKLDWLHSYLLQEWGKYVEPGEMAECIERGVSAFSNQTKLTEGK